MSSFKQCGSAKRGENRILEKHSACDPDRLNKRWYSPCDWLIYIYMGVSYFSCFCNHEDHRSHFRAASVETIYTQNTLVYICVCNFNSNCNNTVQRKYNWVTEVGFWAGQRERERVDTSWVSLCAPTTKLIYRLKVCR